MTEDEKAIRELVDTWMAASKAGDLDTVLSLMADDVIFMVASARLNWRNSGLRLSLVNHQK